MSANPYREPGKQAPEPPTERLAPSASYRDLIDIEERSIWRSAYLAALTGELARRPLERHEHRFPSGIRQADALRARAANLFEAAQVPGGAQALLAEAERLEAETWARYEPAYLAEMRVSYGIPPRGSPTSPSFAAWERGARPRPDAWRDLLQRVRVVLVCFCHRRERCHRGLLARLGAVDGGEIAARPETAREDQIARGPCAVNALQDGRAK